MLLTPVLPPRPLLPPRPVPLLPELPPSPLPLVPLAVVLARSLSVDHAPVVAAPVPPVCAPVAVSLKSVDGWSMPLLPAGWLSSCTVRLSRYSGLRPSVSLPVWLCWPRPCCCPKRLSSFIATS